MSTFKLELVLLLPIAMRGKQELLFLTRPGPRWILVLLREASVSALASYGNSGCQPT